MQPIPDLIAVLGSLQRALVGGVAQRAYASERMTQDVDIVLRSRDASAACAARAAAGYKIVGESSIGGFTAVLGDEPEAMPVDVILREDPWPAVALAEPGFDAAGYPVLPRPYLTLLKLQAGRAQDLADVLRLLAATPSAERASTRRLVGEYAPDLAEDYGSLVSLADLEFGPPEEER